MRHNPADGNVTIPIGTVVFSVRGNPMKRWKSGYFQQSV